MESGLFVVVIAPDGFSTADGNWEAGFSFFFMTLLLFTLRSPSHTKQRSAFPRLCRLCFFSLPPHVQILTFLPRLYLCLLALGNISNWFEISFAIKTFSCPCYQLQNKMPFLFVAVCLLCLLVEEQQQARKKDRIS